MADDSEHSACTVHFGEREFTLIGPGRRARRCNSVPARAAIQLQTALDTRLVLEQAKGILAERFGVDVEEAFDVLRGAARSHSVKSTTWQRTSFVRAGTTGALRAPRRLSRRLVDSTTSTE